MQEITRIHIARVTYDVEVAAKKELEAYMKALKQYAHDDEVYQDIEIRITELLSERGVQRDGVIALEDVKEVRAQLGEPEAFVDSNEEVVATEARKKLYRNTDDAMVAGVLGGIAAYLNIDALWVRLAFIALLIVSFGTALLVYVVLWIVVPVAKTSTEKLEMRGLPVTLQALRDSAERSDEGETRGQRRMRIVGRILSIGIGVTAVCAAVGAVLLTIFGAVALFGFGHINDIPGGSYMQTAVWLGVTAGVLFALFCMLIAYMAFMRTVGKRVGIAALIVMVLGLGVAGSAVGLAVVDDRLQTEAARELVTTRTIRVEGDLRTATTLQVDDIYGHVRYEVSDTVRAEIESMPWIKAKLSVTEGVLSVQTEGDVDDEQERWGPYAYVGRPQITIHGPALLAVETTGSDVEYVTDRQDVLTVTATDSGRVDLYGEYSTLEGTARENASISGTSASIDQLTVAVARTSRVDVGTIGSLALTYDTVCPAGSGSTVTLDASRNSIMQLNGEERAVASVELPCGEVVVNDED